MDTETDNIIASLNLTALYKNIHYIYETTPYAKRTPMKQDLFAYIWIEFYQFF